MFWGEISVACRAESLEDGILYLREHKGLILNATRNAENVNLAIIRKQMPGQQGAVPYKV